jgi:hypothetical protein
MRYAWDQFDAYFGPGRTSPAARRWLYRPVMARMARWDASTSNRVDRFIAISQHVAARIRGYCNIVEPPGSFGGDNIVFIILGHQDHKRFSRHRLLLFLSFG